MGGIDQKDFVQAFVLALSDTTVINKVQQAVCGKLKQEIILLKDLIQKRDQEIIELKERVEKLEQKQDDYELDIAIDIVPDEPKA